MVLPCVWVVRLRETTDPGPRPGSDLGRSHPQPHGYMATWLRGTGVPLCWKGPYVMSAVVKLAQHVVF